MYFNRCRASMSPVCNVKVRMCKTCFVKACYNFSIAYKFALNIIAVSLNEGCYSCSRKLVASCLQKTGLILQRKKREENTSAMEDF